MGGECQKVAIEGDELIIEVQNPLPVDINYKVLLPEKYAYNGREIVDVCLVNENTEAETLSIKRKLKL